MNLFLIKIGKAWDAIRRDGIIQGGRRVMNYLWIFLKTIFTFKSGDVLFITGGVGDSAHYRAYNQAEQLEINGFKASAMIQDNPFLPLFAKRFKIFVFHRVLFTPSVQKLIINIKKQSKEIIFDTDDLVFDEKYIHATDLYKNKMGAFEKMQYATGVGKEILEDPYVKVCTTTTTYLAKILETYGKKVFITPNATSKNEVNIVEKILKKEKAKHPEVFLGYFSGTKSHNKDFATITEPLIKIMDKYPQVRLFIAGPLDIEDRLNEYAKQITFSPLVSRGKHYEDIYRVDINLAPLEMNNPFCDAKSEIKFFGAGILKIPTVAIRNQTFSEAIEDGIDGFLAGTNEEWFEKIEKLILNENLRIEMGEKARTKALADYTTKNSHSEEYYSYLRSKIAICS